MRLSL
jgi:hypothetical protein